MIDLPGDLTRCADKTRIYGYDPFFRDGWDDLRDVYGDKAARADILRDTSLVVFRPDAIVSRNIDTIIQAIGEMELSPVAVFPIQYSRLMVREGWRYQLNIATRDRVDVMDMILCPSQSVAVVFRRQEAAVQTSAPASVLLSEAKGPSDPLKRLPSHFRSRLGDAQASVLTFIHISDEPADVVRELGLFLGQKQRYQALRNLAASYDAAEDLRREIARQYRLQPQVDLSFSGTIAAIRSRASLLPVSKSERDRLLLAIDGLREVKDGTWRYFFGQCSKFGLPLKRWERVAIAARMSVGHIEGMRPFLTDVRLSEWQTATC